LHLQVEFTHSLEQISVIILVITLLMCRLRIGFDETFEPDMQFVIAATNLSCIS